MNRGACRQPAQNESKAAKPPRTRPASRAPALAEDVVPLPEYAASLEDLYEAAGKPEEARQQAARLAVIEKMDQAAGFPANRNLALAYADRGRNLGASNRASKFEAFAVGQGYAEGRLTPVDRVMKDFFYTHR